MVSEVRWNGWLCRRSRFFVFKTEINLSVGLIKAYLMRCVRSPGKIERVADFVAAAPGGFRAHGDVVSARKRRVAMGGGDMDVEEDEEEDGETR